MVKINLKDIEKDKEIYPRISGMNSDAINRYVEALNIGKTFPPIICQRISDNGEEKIILIDGAHRLEAYKQYNRQDGVTPIKEVDILFWKEEVLDRWKHIEEIGKETTTTNRDHGLPLSNKDKKAHARWLVEINLQKRIEDKSVPELTNKELMDTFGVTEPTINSWVKDIRARYRASRDSLIYKLHLLGWNNVEIGNLFGVTSENIRQRTSKLKDLSELVISNFYKSNKKISEICHFHQIDEQLAWAIILDGKDDLERFSLFGKGEYSNNEPKIFNYWMFNDRDPRLGEEHPANIPGQIVMNLLYYYTEPGDLVVDPMAGGGSTIDACLVMGRRCRAYDINPVRKDIQQNDITKESPEHISKCDLLFLNTPYYNEINSFYTDRLVEISLETKKGCIVPVIIQDITRKVNYSLSMETYRKSTDAGFKCIMVVQCPQDPKEIYTAEDIMKAKENKYDLPITRDLFIFRK